MSARERERVRTIAARVDRLALSYCEVPQIKDLLIVLAESVALLADECEALEGRLEKLEGGAS